jgi:hypothetical protein
LCRYVTTGAKKNEDSKDGGRFGSKRYSIQRRQLTVKEHGVGMEGGFGKDKERNFNIHLDVSLFGPFPSTS